MSENREKFKFDKHMKYIIAPDGSEMEWCYAVQWLNDLQNDLDKEVGLNIKAKAKIDKLEAENRKNVIAWHNDLVGYNETLKEREKLEQQLKTAVEALEHIKFNLGAGEDDDYLSDDEKFLLGITTKTLEKIKGKNDE